MSDASAPAAPSAPQQQAAPKPHNVAPLPGAPGAKPAPAKAPVAPEKPAPAEAKPTPTEPPRKFKLNVEGEERELDEAQLQREIARLQKDYAADKRFKEAAEMRKKVEERERLMKERPWDVLKEHGHDPRALAEQYIYELAQQHQMTPEQRQNAELAAKLKEFETREQQRTQQEQQAKLDAEAQRHIEEYTQRFTAALEKTGIAIDGSDPLAPWAFQQLAALEQVNDENGYQAPPELLAEALNEQLTRGATLLLGKLDGEALLSQLEKLSPDLVKKVNAATIERMETKRRGPTGQRQANGTFAPKPPPQAPAEERQPESPAYWNQFRLGLKPKR